MYSTWFNAISDSVLTTDHQITQERNSANAMLFPDSNNVECKMRKTY